MIQTTVAWEYGNVDRCNVTISPKYKLWLSTYFWCDLWWPHNWKTTNQKLYLCYENIFVDIILIHVTNQRLSIRVRHENSSQFCIVFGHYIAIAYVCSALSRITTSPKWYVYNFFAPLVKSTFVVFIPHSCQFLPLSCVSVRHRCVLPCHLASFNQMLRLNIISLIRYLPVRRLLGDERAEVNRCLC